MSYCGVDTCILLSFLYFSTESSLNLFGMGFSGLLKDEGYTQKVPFPKICYTYPTMMKLGTVIPYRGKMKKTYKSRDATLEFC